MSNDLETISIKNVHLLDLQRWLSIGLPAGILNRHRNEFIRSIRPFADEMEHNRLEILKKYVVKDENGNQDLVKAEFTNDEAKESAEKEYDELVNETIIVSISKPAALATVKQLLKTSEIKMGSAEGQRFDEVCDAMGINFDDVKPSEETK